MAHWKKEKREKTQTKPIELTSDRKITSINATVGSRVPFVTELLTLSVPSRSFFVYSHIFKPGLFQCDTGENRKKLPASN